jgi:PAS domain S-box-containing protein
LIVEFNGCTFALTFEVGSEMIQLHVAQAEKYGFDKEAYLCAFKNAPHWERGKVECLMEYYTKLTQMISKKGLANLKLANLLEQENEIQKELKNSKDDLNRAQTVAKIGSWRVSVQGDLFWSDEAYRIFGISIGTPMTYNIFLKFIHPEDCKYVDKQWQAALKGKPYDIEHRIIVNGKTLWVREKAELELDSGGKLLGGFGTVQDITERKKAQDKLEEALAQLERYATHMEQLAEERAIQLKEAERLAAIGATAGMVGHDIRNPLQAIAGDIFLLKSDLSTMPESETKLNFHDSLDGIEKNVFYINKIVADLQDFARPLNPHTEEVDLKLIIDELSTENVLPENVKVSAKIESDVQTIRSDVTFLNRIMFNLVNNAVQAMPQGGKLSINAYKDKQKNDVIITVEDTGVGIPEKAKAKLFTPMFTTKSKGQGFGLAVVKRMAEALDGAVSFDSQENKGTTFIIRLPLRNIP